jgi:hypothetical protein
MHIVHHVGVASDRTTDFIAKQCITCGMIIVLYSFMLDARAVGPRQLHLNFRSARDCRESYMNVHIDFAGR